MLPSAASGAARRYREFAGELPRGAGHQHACWSASAASRGGVTKRAPLGLARALPKAEVRPTTASGGPRGQGSRGGDASRAPGPRGHGVKALLVGAPRPSLQWAAGRAAGASQQLRHGVYRSSAAGRGARAPLRAPRALGVPAGRLAARQPAPVAAVRRRGSAGVREMLQPGKAAVAAAAAPPESERSGAKRGRDDAGGGREAAPSGAGSKRQRRAESSFATHAERRARRAGAAIDELLDELPPSVAEGVLGRRAATQVPDAGARRRLLRKYMRKHAGPAGERAKKGLRAWRKLQEVAARRLLPDFGLPASAALVADCVAEELQRAIGEARAGQDGRTVGGTFRDGFMFLERVAEARRCSRRVRQKDVVKPTRPVTSSTGRHQPPQVFVACKYAASARA